MVMVRAAECTLHTGPSSVVLEKLFMFELFVRKAVVEKHVSCQHCRNPLYIDILVVILVVTSLKCSNITFGVKSCIVIQFGSSSTLTSMSFSFIGMTDTI